VRAIPAIRAKPFFTPREGGREGGREGWRVNKGGMLLQIPIQNAHDTGPPSLSPSQSLTSSIFSHQAHNDSTGSVHHNREKGERPQILGQGEGGGV